jgi:hypothetical protein
MCDDCRYPGELAQQEPDDRPGVQPEPPVIYSDLPPF